MNYIDSWFHFYDTIESFEQHRNKGLINPDSICFIKESGQVYTQNSFFGVCRERYERLEQLAKELDDRFGETLDALIDTKVDKVEGKGLSTNDFTNEDKTKLTSALTSTSIISADKVSGNLSNATINASKIIDLGGQGELITGVIGGDRIHGLLRNASVYGSRVDGKLTNANIDIERVNNLNDIIGSYSIGTFIRYEVNADKVRGNLSNASIGIEEVNKLNDVIGSSPDGNETYYYVRAERLSGISNATIIGSKVSGDLSRATISGSRIYDNINGTIISGAIKASRIQGDLVNAEIHANKIGDTIDGTYVLGAIDGSRLRKNISNATIDGSQVKGKLYYATIDGSNVSGKLTNSTIDGSHVSGLLSNATIDGSHVSGKLTNATIDSSNINGTITAEQILADHSITSTHLDTGAVLPENIASGNLASGVKVNVNALVGYIPAGRLQGNIDKERMRSGFLVLCEELGVVYNSGPLP